MNSFWIDSITNKLNFPSLYQNINTDVCIIGGGIFGITCGYYLSKLNYNVTILDKDEFIGKTTSCTTGKITSQHGLFYNYLINSYNTKFAKDYLTANELAISNIKNIIDIEKINCDFKSQNNYVYATTDSELNHIKTELSSLEQLDFNCDYVTKVGLPFEIKGALCFKNQAQFNPLKYLSGLCNCILSNNNNNIFSKTLAVDIKKANNYYTVYTPNNYIQCKYVVVASHYPFINFPGIYFPKLYQSTSYLMAVDTKKTLFNGMYLNATNPIESYKTANYNNKNILIFGGHDHKTGITNNSQNTFEILKNKITSFYPNCEILNFWNTQDCISLDKLPYIGQYSTLLPNVFVGTGFKKWGMTLSNVAANIIVDKIENKQNIYEYLFNPSRISPIKNRKELKNMIVESSNSLLFKKIKHAKVSFKDISINSGNIIEVNNQKIGIYKNDSGKVFTVKPFCTHLGCLLAWNNIDKTWDCPCHGSRFDFTGKNLYNPALKNLKLYDVD